MLMDDGSIVHTASQRINTRNFSRIKVVRASFARELSASPSDWQLTTTIKVGMCVGYFVRCVTISSDTSAMTTWRFSEAGFTSVIPLLIV